MVQVNGNKRQKITPEASYHHRAYFAVIFQCSVHASSLILVRLVWEVSGLFSDCVFFVIDFSSGKHILLFFNFKCIPYDLNYDDNVECANNYHLQTFHHLQCDYQRNFTTMAASSDFQYHQQTPLRSRPSRKRKPLTCSTNSTLSANKAQTLPATIWLTSARSLLTSIYKS